MWTTTKPTKLRKYLVISRTDLAMVFFPSWSSRGVADKWIHQRNGNASGALCHRPPNSLCVRGEMRHLAGCHPLVIHQHYLVKENRPWKSPGFSGNSSSKPDDCQGRTVNLLGISCLLFHKIPRGQYRRYLIGQDVWPLRCKDFLLTLAMRKRRLEQLEPQRHVLVNCVQKLQCWCNFTHVYPNSWFFGFF